MNHEVVTVTVRVFISILCFVKLIIIIVLHC